MTYQFERKMINLFVAKLRNRLARVVGRACVPRLDLDYSSSQLDLPRLVQRFLR